MQPFLCITLVKSLVSPFESQPQYVHRVENSELVSCHLFLEAVGEMRDGDGVRAHVHDLGDPLGHLVLLGPPEDVRDLGDGAVRRARLAVARRRPLLRLHSIVNGKEIEELNFLWQCTAIRLSLVDSFDC